MLKRKQTLPIFIEPKTKLQIPSRLNCASPQLKTHAAGTPDHQGHQYGQGPG